jgi:hypothetical protein
LSAAGNIIARAGADISFEGLDYRAAPKRNLPFKYDRREHGGQPVS